MGSNIGFSVVKEFLPDLGRALAKKQRSRSNAPPATSGPAEKLVPSAHDTSGEQSDTKE
jgi:hypothetical protein